LGITWEGVVLQSSKENQNHCKALPDHFGLVSTFVPRFNFTENLKDQGGFFLSKGIFFFSKMLENLEQRGGPLGTCCGGFFFGSSGPFGRCGFPPCAQLFESRTVHARHAVFDGVSLDRVIGEALIRKKKYRV